MFTKSYRVMIAGEEIAAIGREVRGPLAILYRAGNRGGAFPVIAHRWESLGKSGYSFSRKFVSHKEARAFVESLPESISIKEYIRRATAGAARGSEWAFNAK